MKVTQTIELDDKERLAIQKVLGLCDEISEISGVTMGNAFDYLISISEIIDEYKYSIGDTLYIADIK